MRVIERDHIAGAVLEERPVGIGLGIGAAQNAGRIAFALLEQGKHFFGLDLGVVLVEDEQVPLLVSQHVAEVAQ